MDKQIFIHTILFINKFIKISYHSLFLHGMAPASDINIVEKKKTPQISRQYLLISSKSYWNIIWVIHNYDAKTDFLIENSVKKHVFFHH